MQTQFSRFRILGLFVLIGAMPSLALAAEGQSSVRALPQWTHNLFANYTALVHGPSINHLDLNAAADRNGNPGRSGAYNLDGTLTAGYMANPQWGAGLDLPFVWTPSAAASVNNFMLGDIGVRLLNNRTISRGGFTLNTNLILQAPTNSFSSARGMVLGVKTTPNVRYAFSGSRWSVGALSEFKDYLGVRQDKAFKIWMAPWINYRLNEKLSFNLLYEQELDHFAGKPGFQTFQSDFEPGIQWKISRNLMLNPFLQIFTTQATSLDHTALGALLNASI